MKTFDSVFDYYYKLALDGYDLEKKFNGGLITGIGNDLIKPSMIKSIGWLETFHTQTVEDRNSKAVHTIPKYLCDKYEVGVFTVAPTNCNDLPYVLFDEDCLNFWTSMGINLWGLEFMVAPSYGVDGKLNNVGLRVLDTQLVNNAVKWIFPCGQSATFGQHLYKPGPPVFVEGFADMIAFHESGVHNVIGLGSISLTDDHISNLHIDVTDAKFCFDYDTYGSQQSGVQYSPRRTGQDPFDSFAEYGQIMLGL